MSYVTALAVRELDAAPDGDGRSEVEVRVTLCLLPNESADVILFLNGALAALWRLLDIDPARPPGHDGG